MLRSFVSAQTQAQPRRLTDKEITERLLQISATNSIGTLKHHIDRILAAGRDLSQILDPNKPEQIELFKQLARLGVREILPIVENSSLEQPIIELFFQKSPYIYYPLLKRQWPTTQQKLLQLLHATDSTHPVYNDLLQYVNQLYGGSTFSPEEDFAAAIEENDVERISYHFLHLTTYPEKILEEPWLRSFIARVVQRDPSITKMFAKHQRDLKLIRDRCLTLYSPSWSESQAVYADRRPSYVSTIRKAVDPTRPSHERDAQREAMQQAWLTIAQHEAPEIDKYIGMYATEGDFLAHKLEEKSAEDLGVGLAKAHSNRQTRNLQGAIFNLYVANLIEDRFKLSRGEKDIVDSVAESSAQTLKEYLLPRFEYELAEEAITTKLPGTIKFSDYNDADYVREKLSPFYDEYGRLTGTLAEEKERAADLSFNWSNAHIKEKSLELARDTSIEELKDLFALAPWEPQYGGPMWAQIALYVHELEKANTPKDVMRAFDRLAHSAHNTGPAFDKPSFQAIEDQYMTILDAKAHVRGVRLMYPYLDDDLQYIVAPYLRARMVAQRKMPRIIIAQANDQLLGTTRVIIDPQLQGRIQDAINDLRQSNPEILKDITHIYALHSSNFGEWHSNDPHAIFINLEHIENEVKRQLKQGLSPEQTQSEIVKDEITKAIREQLGKTIVHEHSHVVAPEKGEPFAEQRERSYKMPKTAALREFAAPRQVVMSRFANREKQHFRKLLKDMGFTIKEDGSVTYVKEPVRKSFKSVWDAIEHEKQVVDTNRRLIRLHEKTADPKVLERKNALIILALRRLHALQLWNKTFGQDFPLPGYKITYIGNGEYTVTKPNGEQYIVNREKNSCTCPAGQRGKLCKHLKAVLWKLKN